jgi:hypothetical protein
LSLKKNNNLPVKLAIKLGNWYSCFTKVDEISHPSNLKGTKEISSWGQIK